MSHGYYPWRFDLGGVLLGSMVGLGALLLIPKVINLLVPELGTLGPTYGSLYKRSRHSIIITHMHLFNFPIDFHEYLLFFFTFTDVDFLPQGLNEIAVQFEKILTENKINSSECLQKVICSYIQSSASKSQNMAASIASNNDVYKSIR